VNIAEVHVKVFHDSLVIWHQLYWYPDLEIRTT
jgi:hypothetical protein